MATSNGNRAIAQARWQLQTICKPVAAYDAARERQYGDFTTLENIHQHPLSVSVRGDWEIPGSLFAATGYQSQLCWGGPAVRLIGDLDGEEPKTARLEYQDWFTPWQELAASPAERRKRCSHTRASLISDNPKLDQPISRTRLLPLVRGGRQPTIPLHPPGNRGKQIRERGLEDRR